MKARRTPAEGARAALAQSLALALAFRRGAAIARREGRIAHAEQSEASAARLLAHRQPARDPGEAPNR